MAALLVALLALPARAEEARAPKSVGERAPGSTRSYGIGVGSTGGWFQGRTRSLKWDAPSIGLVDVNLFVQVTSFLNLQLWLPVSWMLWESRVDGPFFNAALIARLYPLGDAGLFIGPGIDLHAFHKSSESNTNYAVTFPIALGYETGFPDESFGFTIALRPEFGVLLDRNVGSAANFGLGSSDVTTRGFSWGLLLELDFTGYVRRAAGSARAP